MHSTFLRTGFLVNLVAIAFLSGITACATASQNQSNSPQDMGQHHGGGNMNHGMEMDLGPADTDYNLRFIDAMIPHHQGAIIMAQEAQSKSTHPEIKQLADEIINAQAQEISQLKQWRKTWYPNAGDKPMVYSASQGQMIEMTPEQRQSMMMKMDLGAADAEFDLRFMDAMIPHHQGAIKMAQDALSKSKKPEIKQLAQAIVTSQQKEINQMKQWQEAWYQK